MKNNLVLGAVVALGMGFASSSAMAAPYLYNTVQQLEDGDAETLLNADGTVKAIGPGSFIQVGDLFGGVIKIQQTFPVPAGTPEINLQSGSTFTAFFLIDTKSILSTGDATTADGSFEQIFFGAATQAQWNTVFGAGGAIDISSVLDVSNINGSGSGIASGTMALMFNDVLYSSALFEAGGTMSGSATSFIQGGTLQYEFGFTGAGGAADANQFWKTTGVDATMPTLAITNDLINRLALDVTRQWAGPDLAPHNYLLSAGDGNYTGETQFQGKGNFEQILAGSPWALQTDSDLFISPVPEPSALALISLGLMGLGWVGRRTSKQA